jgi:flavin-dependent dehydrogenase
MKDVVVVGASVAGASTAIHLARSGLTVQLLDRAEFPRRKACGEGLFPRGVEALEELGVQVLGQAMILESLRVELAGASVEARLASPTHPAIGVRREVLDAALLQRARQCDVEVSLGVTAIDLLASPTGYRAVRTNRGEFAAGAIVVADGLRSRLRRVAGLDTRVRRQRYGVSARYRLRDLAEARVQIRMLAGYELYVTPVGRQAVNVALLVDKRQSKMLAGHLGRTYDAIVQESGILPNGATLLDSPLAGGPFPAGARRDWHGNLVLVGDAAGFFDGISGEGMSLALVASEFAARAVQRFLQDGNPAHFATYEQARRRLGRNSNLLARISLLLAAHPSLGQRAIGNLSRQPRTFEKILAINSGVTGLAALTPRDVGCLLLGV